MNQTAMNIAISVNRRYLPYAYVMLSSLLYNNPAPMQIYVFHQEADTSDIAVLEELTDKYPVTFHYHAVPAAILERIRQTLPDLLHPESCFYRYIPELLSPELERILYLDCDLIVNGSLESLYFSDLSGKALAASRSDSGILDGVLLFDLHAPSSSWSKLLSQPDDANILFLDPLQYHLSARSAYTDLNLRYDDMKGTARIIHYNGAKPWEGNCLHCDIEWLWWDYAKNTPFYETLMEQTMREIITDTTLHTYISNIRLENCQLNDVVKKYELLLTKIGIPF